MAQVPWPLLLILLQLALVACQVAIKISSGAPPTFTDELKEPKFMVGVLPEGTHRNLPTLGSVPAAGGMQDIEQSVGPLAGSSVPPHARTLPMTDSNGTKYSCYLPALEGQETTSISVVGRPLLYLTRWSCFAPGCLYAARPVCRVWTQRCSRSKPPESS